MEETLICEGGWGGGRRRGGERIEKRSRSNDNLLAQPHGHHKNEGTN